MGDDHFADFDEATTSQPVTPATTSGDQSGGSFSGGQGGNFANEIYSEKISAKFRTFFIDVKESGNGKFVKISEKSRGGKKSTIMMDSEDVPEFIEALKRASQKLG